ncbi:MAG: AarF/ABC1/UbiB kinase family protein [Methylovirgula sp.]|jgi:predicted unusual protein kinase regulating ubiquinone biosynthesis (AarF/ABC1/UbiB family)
MNEDDRLSARAARHLRIGAHVGGAAARIAGARLFGGAHDDSQSAAALAQALGQLKGPLMKVAQMLATIPEALPPEYAESLAKLQAHAPPMGAAFVRRRMQAELGPHWQEKFAAFDLAPVAAASLGQVHKAQSKTGEALACKLQYPDMASAVEADLQQLDIILGLHRRLQPAIDTREIAKEIAARLREELDYRREARHTKLYREILSPYADIRVPAIDDELSTARLLTMQWLEGKPLRHWIAADEADRNLIGTALFKAWWMPFAHYGVIHGDPHLGNYTVFGETGAEGINLFDFGCIRIFPPRFVAGVVDLYEGLRQNDAARIVHAYESWGFRGLARGAIEALNIWARFIYGPLLDDRVRTIADGISPGHYGRREAFAVHSALKAHGPITVPREFVFMDRAAIGLGGAFLQLGARLNFYRLFNAAIADFSAPDLAARQGAALAKNGLALAA